MSLALIQSYSSSEEEEVDDAIHHFSGDDISDDEQNGVVPNTSRSYKPLFDTNPASSSSLPSALDAFSEVAGPPQFLNNSVSEGGVKEDVPSHGGRRNRKEKKGLPSGAVLESKPQLVGIHERVRSDIGSSGSEGLPSAQGVKRVATAANPNAEDAAELLRMCLACGVPKTYSHSKGMVCPMCGDRPQAESDKAPVKKGSAIKDKEKSKRMKGQSSHATWKSETEMQLRQQFD